VKAATRRLQLLAALLWAGLPQPIVDAIAHHPHPTRVSNGEKTCKSKRSQAEPRSSSALNFIDKLSVFKKYGTATNII
jgi:hypothetical protein